MRRNVIFLLSLLLCLNTAISFGQTVDEIIAKYTTAMGGLDKIKAVKTEKTVLTVETGGMTINQTIYKKRPGMLREETLLQGKTSLQVFNGTRVEYAAIVKVAKNQTLVDVNKDFLVKSASI